MAREVQNKEKSRSGEVLDRYYVTTFKVPLYRAGQFTLLPLRVLCPQSEFDFYRLIGGMYEKGSIRPLTHMTAELQMFLEGYKIQA
jgi:hypothetical protein